jgi:divalent metal cation (Fe/Co/Zn/Cd) transporter
LGALLLYEAASTLIKQEHPTIGSFHFMGHEIWLGWAMIGALLYSAIPPVILGRLKKPVAAKINDKVLHTDALMNAADWQTALAGILGIVGVAFGYWWADALAAGFISLSVLMDGSRALRTSVVELIDGAPRRLNDGRLDPLVPQIIAKLTSEHGAVNVQIRETGRYMRATIEPANEPHISEDQASTLTGPDSSWRLIEVGVEQRRSEST